MLNKTCLKVKKIVIMFFVFIILNCSPGWPGATTTSIVDEDLFQDKMNTRITLDLKDASLRDVLKMLSVQSGLNFISSEAVADRSITLFLDNALLKDALDKIFAVNNLTYILDPESNIFIVKDWGKPTIDLDTRIYFLKYAAATNSRTAAGIGGMKDALGNVISEQGKIIEDPATNSMIVTDMPSKFPLIEQIIAKLDVPIPQVMIEVEILDVDKSDVDKLGLKWSGNNWFTFTGPSNFKEDLFPHPNSLAGVSRYTMAWKSVLELLSTRSTTKFLARPKLFVLNNETAEIKLSSQEAIGVTTEIASGGDQGVSTSTESAERAETGVILKVTPQISMATGEITMAIEPAVKEAISSSILVNNQPVKDVEERSIKSTVRLRDGETIILGGLIRQKNPNQVTKIPFLGDIPILGMLFRHRESGPRKDREILVFLTPRIMKNSPRFAEGAPSPSYKVFTEREQEPLANFNKNEIVSRALGIYDTKQ